MVLIIALAFTGLILGGIGALLIYGHLSPRVEAKPSRTEVLYQTISDAKFNQY